MANKHAATRTTTTKTTTTTTTNIITLLDAAICGLKLLQRVASLMNFVFKLCVAQELTPAAAAWEEGISGGQATEPPAVTLIAIPRDNSSSSGGREQRAGSSSLFVSFCFSFSLFYFRVTEAATEAASFT